MVCRKSDDALIGYAASSERHTYFRCREGVLELVKADTPDASLEDLAFGFVGEWLWYDEEEAPVERARYADYGYRYAARISNRRSWRCCGRAGSSSPRSTRPGARCARRSPRNGWTRRSHRAAAPLGAVRLAERPAPRRLLEWGDPRNRGVLVCVHGLTRSARDFDTLARELCGQFRVVCPDVAGRGDSDRLADPMLYAVPQYVADMVTLIARLDVEAVHWSAPRWAG